MIAIVSLIVVLLGSLIVVRVATVALTLTGLSRELARFQARSAFTGCGFTSSESEDVLRHPVRRRIIMLLMLLGNAGIITVMSSLVLSFVDLPGIGSLPLRIGAMLAGLLALWSFANSRWVDRKISVMIGWALGRWTRLDARDYGGLLHLTGDYVVVELQVQAQDWLAKKKLAELKLSDEGVLVLGIEKSDCTYLGAPRGETLLEPGDTLLLYGRQDVLDNLDERRAGSEGNWEHHKAIDHQRRIEAEEAAVLERMSAKKESGRRTERGLPHANPRSESASQASRRSHKGERTRLVDTHQQTL